MTQLPGLDSLAAATDRAFLACVAAHPDGISRAQVSAETGISKPAISDAASRMLDQGVIREAGQTRGRPGRVATLLQINPGRGHGLVIEINARHSRVATVDLTGAVIGDLTEDEQGTEAPEELASRLRELIDQLTAEIGSPRLVTTVSVAQPVVRGTFQVAGLDPTPFPAGTFDPTTALGIDPAALVVDNDVNWATLAEAEARDTSEDFLYLYAGAGIGAGIYIDGRVREGAHGFSGELGYSQIEPGLDLTQYLVLRGFGHHQLYQLDPALITTLLDHPDRARAAVDEALEAFCRVTLNTTLALNPSLVVVGGPWGKHRVVLERLRSTLQASIDPPAVELSVVGDEGPFQGALFRAIHRTQEAVGFTPREEHPMARRRTGSTVLGVRSTP